jgi:hypothetical protein
MALRVYQPVRRSDLGQPEPRADRLDARPIHTEIAATEP